MKLSRISGCIAVAVVTLMGCSSPDSSSDSSSDSASSETSIRPLDNRPLGSRPASSVEIDVFNDVVAAAKQAPEAAAPGTANLFTNPGFEDGVGGWSSCASNLLNVSKDASEGAQALLVEPNNCIYRSVQVNPGGTYFLSCDVKLDPSKAWTGMGLVFANSDYKSLLDAPVAVATSGEYMTITSKGTAPAGTSFVNMWIHSDFGALVDNCSLLLEADRPRVTPDSGNLLDNSSFHSVDAKGDLENWTSGCTGEILTTDSNITLTNGACVDQSLNTVAIASIENSFTRFGCYISGSEGYSDMSIYLDGELAATHQIQPIQKNTFVSVDLDVNTASNGFVTLYSDGSLTAEHCTFDTAGPAPIDNADDGSIAVEFESSTLEQLVKDRLGITQGPVTRNDMLLLTSLSYSDNVNAELDSLVGLEYATNLNSIDFNGPPIKSLEPLAGLTSLDSLFLYGAVIDSVAPLAELSSLVWIAVGTAPELSDISVFANNEFPELLYLVFTDNSSISDLTPLSGLALRALTIEGGKVTDPSPIASMSSLSSLELTGSKLPNLQPLLDGSILTESPSTLAISPEFVDLSEGSPDRLELEEFFEKKGDDFQILLRSPSGEQSLRPTPEATNGDGSTAVVFESAALEEIVKSELLITGRSVTRDDMLSLTHLTRGYEDAGVTSLSGLEYADNLTAIIITDWPIDSLAPLEGLTSLTSMVITRSPIESLAPLAGLPSLRLLYITGSSITSLAPLEGVTSLRELQISGSAIDSLSPLAGHTSLRVLDLGDASTDSLAPLAGLTELAVLRLDNAPIDDLTPLAGLTSLSGLYLPRSSVDSLAPLAGLTSLQSLTLSTVPEFSDLSVFANQALPRLFSLEFLGRSSISDLTPLIGYKLNILTVENGKVTDPSPIASMANMYRLEITGSKLTNLQSLANGTIFTEAEPPELGPHIILSSAGLDLSENSADRLALEDIEAKKQPEFKVLLRSPTGELLSWDGSEVNPEYAEFQN